MGDHELTADEKLLARAEANGYERGAHTDADQTRGRGRHVKKTTGNQDRTLRRYILWQLAAMRKEYAQKGMPLPDEETARCKHLGPGVAAPDLTTVKDFIRFYIAISKPFLDAKRPTVDSINTIAEWFFAGFTRVTGTDTVEEERSEVYNWVRYTLTLEGIVVKKHRPKHNFTPRDQDRVMLALWTRNDTIFIPERYRVQTTFIINVYCWTGARIGAFFTGGLRYKDVEIVLQRTSSRGWRLIYKINQRWVKNNRDPDHVVFGAATKDHPQLFYNDAGFLLSLALADDALFGYESLEDVQTQEIPEGQDELPLRFKDSALDRPILRKCTKSGGVTDEPMPKSSFTDIFRSALTNAGYFCGTSIHAIRRQLGKSVDKRYTAVQRSQHLTQADERVFGQSYVANCSSVDGQAAFRNEETDHRHIEYFQSLEKFHEEGLPGKLPAHLEESLDRDPQLCKLRTEVRTLSQNGVSTNSLKKAKLAYSNHLKKLKTKALRQYREHWVKERRDWKILTRGKVAARDQFKTDFVHDIYSLIPERGRLAQIMDRNLPLEPGEMWQALQDLYTLCVQDFTVFYLPRSRPVDGACPAKCCQLHLGSLPKTQRNQHVQNCVRWEMASRLDRLQSEVHYCYRCFDWVVGEEWEPHCRSHLGEMENKRCGTITYCHTLVRPAYCPFCIGDAALPAAKRLESWTRDHKLWSHVNEHLRESRWPRVCPHPQCDAPVKDAVAFRLHLVDEHEFSRACLGKPAGLAAPAVEKDVLGSAMSAAQPTRKRRSSSGHKVLEWTPTLSLNSPVSLSEPSPFRPPKRARRSPSTINPAALSPDNGLADVHDVDDFPGSAMLSALCFPASEDDAIWADFERDPDPVQCPSLGHVAPSLLPEDDRDDALFDQYLRSPSPTPPPSPDDAASELSGATLVDAKTHRSRGHPDLSSAPTPGTVPEMQVAQEQENPCRSSTGPSLRLRVSQPKITLRLRLPDQRPLREKKQQTTKEDRKVQGRSRKQRHRSKKDPRKGRKGQGGRNG